MTSAPEATRYALFISVAEYADEQLDAVPSANDSAVAMRKLFASSGMWTCEPHVKNPGDHWELMRPLDDVVQRCTEADTLLVYYVGHADEFVREDGANEIGLTLRRSKSREEWSYLPLRHLYEKIRWARARSKVLILDACHCNSAGHLAQPQLELKRPPYLRDAERGDGPQRNSTAVLKPRNKNDVRRLVPSKYPGENNYTLFSGTIIDILRAGIPGGHNPLTVKDLKHGLWDHLAKAIKPRSPDDFNQLSPDLISRDEGYSIELFENPQGGDAVSGEDLKQLESLAPPELADALAGAAQLNVPISKVREHIAEHVLPSNERTKELAHHLHAQLDANRLHTEFVEMLCQDADLDRIAQAASVFGTNSCLDCAEIERRIDSWATAQGPQVAIELHKKRAWLD